MASPAIEFSTDVTAEDFNICFDGTYQELLDNHEFHVEGKEPPSRGKTKAAIYRAFIESPLCIKGYLNGELVGLITGEMDGTIYQANIALYAEINGSKSHLYDPELMMPYEEAQRDFFNSLGITQIRSTVFKPSPNYDYHFINKPGQVLWTIVSETLYDTRVDGKTKWTVLWEYI